MKKKGIHQPLWLLLLLFGLFFSIQNVQSQENITRPVDHFGFEPGADRMLFTYEELIVYLKKLEQESDKIALVEAGTSPLGKPIYIAFISSGENISRLNELKEINKKLALDPSLSDKDIQPLKKQGKVFALGTLSMHSNEVGPSQAAAKIAYDLISTRDEQTNAWLQEVVYMMIPCHNPDGMDMVVTNYQKYKGTKYEGTTLPGIYHKYVGHDNNRDFVTLTQPDTRAISRIYSTEWFPQVMVEKHQMGSTGVRYFVPPNHDPIAENVDEGLWNWIGIFGSNMVKDMTAKGQEGVAQQYIFDNYWPGSTETCLWKNVISFLTEAASAQTATPIYIEPNELRVGGKGLSEYKKSVNFTLPWEGGWWKLSDIVDYEYTSTLSMLKTSYLHKNDILQFRNDICKKEVQKGLTEAPFYYVFPVKQNDQGELVNLVNLLQEHGVSVSMLTEDIVHHQRIFKKGDIVVPLAQPYRAFIKEALEKQVYPERHYTPDGELITPYDITSWSLPLHMGVKSLELNERNQALEKVLEKIDEFSLRTASEKSFKAILLRSGNNESYHAAFAALQSGLKVERVTKGAEGIQPGSFIIHGTPENDKMQKITGMLTVDPEYLDEMKEYTTKELKMPRIALIETYFHDMDAGWTRFVFDTYHIPYKVLHPGEVTSHDLKKEFDVIVFPNSREDILVEGKRKYRDDDDDYHISNYPPEYTKGMGKEGKANILQFIDQGGTVLSWGSSTKLFMGLQEIKNAKGEKEEFQLPVSDISEKLKKKGLSCSGSMVNINVKENHPLTYGMNKQTGVFYRGQPVFATSIPNFDMDRRVIASFPEKDILLSGYCKEEKLLEKQAVMVWVKKNKGQLVLYGFYPQFRANTKASYKLLFNALFIAQ